MSYDCINEGKGMSSFTEAPLNVNLMNNVPYGEHQEWGTMTGVAGRYFTLRALYKSEYIMSKAIEDWMKACSANGRISIPKKPQEVVA
jgi:hypothetical protein